MAESVLGYTVDDDGIHLACRHESALWHWEVVLGHEPTAQQVADAWRMHLMVDHPTQLDIRDDLLPVSDDAEAGAVAQRVTRALLQEISRPMTDVDASALRLVGLLGHISEPDLEGVQALGMAIATYASQWRRIAIARG